jgi:ubiquinone biosynthesis protein
VPVTVTIVHPDIDRIRERDLPLLMLLRAPLGLSGEAMALAIADFATTLDRRLDLRQQAAALALVGQDARESWAFRVPYCYRDFSSRRVLTSDRIDGVRLTEVLAADPADLANAGRWPAPAALADRLTTAWLSQASNGRSVPFDFGPHDILVGLEHVTLVGGTFEMQTSEGQAHFLNYLEATAADDVDAACAWVVGRSERQPGGLDEEALTRRFRQAVPFRDVESDGDERLVDQLLVHWRVTQRAGWQVAPHQARLYHGLATLTALTDRLGYHGDALLAALRSEQLRRRLAGARELLQVGTLDKLLTNMVNLPRRVDEALSLAAEGGMRLKLQLPEADAQRKARNRAVTHVAGLVALMAFAFLVKLLVPELGESAERVGALLLLIFGGWLLVAAARL